MLEFTRVSSQAKVVWIVSGTAVPGLEIRLVCNVIYIYSKVLKFYKIFTNKCLYEVASEAAEFLTLQQIPNLTHKE